ncbi:MAG: shikimate kinase [Desulfopila sp.]|nr:shikimate kinase [Desulfopila sp.]
MTARRSNIILIGMPGSGKSTVGIILAKLTGKSFLDTDVLIQTIQGRTLQQIVDTEGHMSLRRIEEQVLLSLDISNHVISTGGSAPYSPAAMNHLQKDGIIIFLHADLNTLRKRITNFDTRGLAKRPDQSFADLFAERMTLYRHYSEIMIESSGHSQEEVCEEILTVLDK